MIRAQRSFSIRLLASLVAVATTVGVGSGATTANYGTVVNTANNQITITGDTFSPTGFADNLKGETRCTSAGFRVHRRFGKYVIP
jgi:hypothetical protein